MHLRISTSSATMHKTPTLLQMNCHRGWLLQLRYQPNDVTVVDNASSQVRRMLRMVPNNSTATISTTTSVESRRFITMVATVSNHNLVFSCRISSLSYYPQPFGITMTQQQKHRWNSTGNDNITQKNDVNENEEINSTTATTTTTTTLRNHPS